MTQTNKTLLPLAGVQVVEFCSTAAGPFSAMLLADMGATVIKVDVDKNPAAAQAYGVRGVPTLAIAIEGGLDYTIYRINAVAEPLTNR